MRVAKVAGAIEIFICLVFCCVGLGFSVWGLMASPMGEDSWMLAAFGLVFAGFGVLPLYLISRARRKKAKEKQFLTLHPGQPWLLREDWAQGRAKSDTRKGMFAAWFFAIFWNAVSSPLLFFFPDMVKEAGAPAYLALLFPLVGVGLLVWAVRMTIRWRTFGKTWFEMASVPGVRGGTLEGSIRVRFPQPPEQGVILRLTCFHRYVVGSGKNQSTHEKILWQEEQTIPFGSVLSAPGASSIPVRFPLPTDAPETNTENSRDSFHWVLSAEASVPGVDYSDAFEVPVFGTKESPSAEEVPTVTAPAAPASVSLREIERSGIRVGPSPTGGMQFYFSAARNPGSATAVTVFFCIWSVIVWFLYHSDAPIIFPIFFGFFEVLIFLGMMQLWFWTSTVAIGSGTLTSRRGYLGIGSLRRVPITEIAGLRMKIGMQSRGRQGSASYDIKMVLKGGKEHTLGGNIRNKRHAEWLLEQMCSASGLKQLS